MSPELQQYYEDLLGVFAHPGWKHLVEGWTVAYEALDTVSDLHTVEALHTRRGQCEELRRMINFPEEVRQSFDQLKEADIEDDDEPFV